MNKYESIIIMDSKLTEEQKRAVINKIEEYLISNGKVTKIDNLGLKKLAYDIKGHNTAYYYLIEFETDASKVYELERIYRITEEILKFMVVRKDN